MNAATLTPRERHLADIGMFALRHGITRDDVMQRRKGSKCLKLRTARRAIALHFREQNLSWPQIGRIVDRHHTTVMCWAGVV